MGGELGLEVVQFRVGAAPLGVAAEAFDPFDEYATIPGAIVNCDAAGARRVAPKAPEVVVLFFFVGGLRDGDHAKITGVECAREPADRAALAGGVPTLEDPHDGAAPLGGGADGAVEATEPFVAFFPVGGFGEGLIEVEGEQAPEAGGAQRDGAAGLGSGTDF